jgi:diguanylate cyclase (GGDEF)-like protein/PAS domain S-box-containing protein
MRQPELRSPATVHLWAVVAWLLLLLPLAAAHAESLERVTLQLKWFDQFQFAGYYAALDKGYYAEEGLDVEFRLRDPAHDPVDEVLAGRADYGITDAGLALAALRGKPLVLVAQIFQHSPLVYITRQTEDLHTPFDLIGRPIMGTLTGETDTPLIAMLLDTVGDLDQLDIQPLSFRTDDLVDGTVDAYPGYLTDLPFVYEQAGLGVRIIDPRDYGIDFYGDNLFTTRDEAANNPGRVARMRRATLRGWNYALQYPDEIIDLILKRYNPQGQSRPHLEYQAETTQQLITPEFIELGSYSRARWTKITQTYARLGLAERYQLPDSFFFTPQPQRLSSEERNYLARRAAVRVGILDEQPPLTYLNNGQPRGFLNDLFSQVSGMLGLSVQWHPLPDYKTSIEALSAGEVDLLTDFSTGTAASPTPLQSAPLVSIPFVAVGRIDTPPIRSIEDLVGKPLVMVRGYQQTRVIQSAYPHIEVHLVDSIAEAYRELRTEQADYYIDNATHAGHYLHQYMVTDLEIRGQLPAEEVGRLELRFAIRADDALLLSTLDKALATLGEDGIASLRTKWLRPSGRFARSTALPLDLTTRQRAWLTRHEKIEIGIVDSWPPFSFRRADGELVGITVDLVKALNGRLDKRIQLAGGAWPPFFKAVIEGRLAAVMDVRPTRDRNQTVDFTKPYAREPNVIVAPKDGPRYHGVSELYGRTVALESGFANVAYFEANHPAIRIRTYPTTSAALGAVSTGEADAYVGNRAVASYLLRRELFIDLEVQKTLTGIQSELAIAVRKDWPELTAILQAALDNLTFTERDAIYQKWRSILPDEGPRPLQLTQTEEAWLSQHPVIRVSMDPGWAPIEFAREDGSFGGISTDYLRRLGELLGIRFEPIAVESWEDAMNAMRDGRAQVLASVAKTPKRSQVLAFTRPYLEFPIRIFTRSDVSYVGNIQNLIGQRVAVTAGYAIIDWLKRDYPALELVETSDSLTGLRLLADRQVDAFLGNVAVANYYISKYRLTDLRIAGETPYVNRQVMATHKDNAILTRILQKALNAIPVDERQTIYNRWMSVQFEQGIDYRPVWQIGIPAALLLFFLFLWNQRLKREVTQRQAAEAKLLESQDLLEQRVQERTTDLAEAQARFRATFEQAAVGIARVGLDGTWLEVNDHLCRMFGYTRDELLRITFQALTHPDDLDSDMALVNETLAGQRDSYTMEKRYLHKEGHIVWATLTVSLVRTTAGEPDYFISVLEDISERKRVEDTLDRFFDQPMTLNLIANMDGRIERMNSAWSQTLGYPLEELLRRPFIELVHPEDRAATLAEFDKVKQGHTTLFFENRYLHQDGSYLVLAWSSFVKADDGLIVAVANDITEKRQAEDKLREAAAVFGNTAEGVMITDDDGHIMDVNEAFSLITGYAKEEVVNRKPSLLRSDRHDDHFYAEMWKTLITTGHWRGELWNRRKDGAVYPELLTISRMTDKSGRGAGYVGVFADITAIKQTEDQLSHLAHHDSLTSLPNRLLLTARLDQAIRHAERQNSMLVIVFIDVDRFKTINDSLGHPAGDQVLRELARRLLETIGPDDTAARLSGDEFIVLLDGPSSTEQVVLMVERLMRIFEKPFMIGGTEVRITASMGLSLYPNDGRDSATLLRNADAAMYRAKDDGRNTYQFYTSELTSVAFEQMFLENALRSALKQNEFRLVYQPQFDLTSKRLIGLESLLRWDHPQQGTIPPGRFIPIAEQSGLIRDIGTWVIQEACRQAAGWAHKGLSFGRMAVNVAGPQIQQAGFETIVREALRNSGLSADRLELEITESFVMQRTDISIEQLSHLRSLGVEVAIDDFGTGYSSLSYLKQLPIDKLKIDQAFVRDIPADANDMAIAEAVIAMGRALNLMVIAEGVENKEQADFLRAKGCTLAQGYYFSKPLSAEDTEALMNERLRQT